MNNSALPHQVRALLLVGAGLVVALLLGWNIGSQNYLPLLISAVVVGVACIAIFPGRFFWVLTIASSFLAGTFPALGGSFTPFQILMAVGVAKFLIEDIVLRRTRLRFGNRLDLLLLLGFMAILTWHGIHDRFGMRFLGSSVWGGRNYVNVYVGLAAFFVVQSIPMSPKTWVKLPYLVLAVTGFDLLIAIITTVFPSSIYTIYPFYSAVSLEGIKEILTWDIAETARLGSFGGFGNVLIMLVLASVSVRQILRPPILFRGIVLLVGFAAVLFSSFRSSVINALTVSLVAAIRDLKWGILAILPFLAALLIGVSVINSVIPLPKQVQRSLAFLPGQWDPEMKRDATASNKFRGRIWSIFTHEYFLKHPLVGRGFGFQSEWAKGSVYKYDPYADVQMVEVGNVHNGFLSSLDAWGMIGTAFFIGWNIRLLSRTFRVSFRREIAYGMPLRFLALCLGASILCYWMGAAGVGTFLPREFALAGVFLCLQRRFESISPRISASTSVLDQNFREELATA
jgi:hypothetical protein